MAQWGKDGKLHVTELSVALKRARAELAELNRQQKDMKAFGSSRGIDIDVGKGGGGGSSVAGMLGGTVRAGATAGAATGNAFVEAFGKGFGMLPKELKLAL